MKKRIGEKKQKEKKGGCTDKMRELVEEKRYRGVNWK